MAARKAPTRVVNKKAPPTSSRQFSLNIGSGFTLLTEQVDGASCVATRAEPGSTLSLQYWKELADVTRITLHLRIDGEAKASQVVATLTGQRLMRRPAQVELPADATLLEYWFELETKGEPLWDSNWGKNHRLELTSAMVPASSARAPRAEA